MAKQKITREMVLQESYRIALESGMDQVQVKTIAANLNCSVQPVYSYFKNMEDLKEEIIQKAYQQFLNETKKQIRKDDYFITLGYGFLTAANQNRYMFGFFKDALSRKLEGFEDLFDDEAASIVAENLGISHFEAKELLNNMMIYILGLCDLLTYENFDLEMALRQLEIGYDSFLAKAKSASH